MSFYCSTPVFQVPELVLSGWRFIRSDRNEIFLAGYNETEREGRVSSCLVTFDRALKCATTFSGRRYLLLGMPGLGSDAKYVFGRWLELNQVKAWEDVTELVTVEGLDAALQARAQTLH